VAAVKAAKRTAAYRAARRSLHARPGDVWYEHSSGMVMVAFHELPSIGTESLMLFAVDPGTASVARHALVGVQIADEGYRITNHGQTTPD
jgi:hypothetical protein